MKSKLTKRGRRFGVLAASVGAAALIAGFFGATADAETLRVGTNAMPVEKGDIHFAYSASSVMPNMAFFDSLTYIDASGTILPGLALSWEAKGTDAWVFKLRPNVKFHNGRAMTAEDVVAAVTFLLSKEGSLANAARQIHGMKSARAIDDLTVEISMKVPNPILPRQATIIRIPDPKVWTDLGRAGFARNPVGTGAYRVTSYGAAKIEAVAFAESWRPAKIEQLEFIELPEIAARVQALQSGQIDIGLVLSPDSRGAVEAAGGKLVVAPTSNVMTLMLHSVQEGPLQDVRIRQALNYAVNKQAFIDEVMGGMTKASGQPATRSMNGYQSGIAAYPYDPDKAKQLLSEAGFPDGLKLSAEIITTQGEFRDVYQHVANNLSAVGIELELVVISTPDLIKKILKRAPWKGDAHSMQYEGYPTADAMRAMNTHSCIFFNPWTCDKRIQPTITAANQEFDPGKRGDLVAKVMQFYHDEATALYLYDRVQIDGLAANVRNYQVVDRTINWHEIELAN